MIALRAENLGLEAGGRRSGFAAQASRLLWGVSAEFAPGLIHAVVGPNGAGKTTLLRLLALLVRPSEGRVLVGGEDATSRWPDTLELRRRLSFVQQKPVLFRASVFDNVAAGLRFRGLRGEALRSAVAEALAFVGLEGYERRWPGSLSGGEAQKVALARAVACRPEVLLLDEPCASLDPASSALVEARVAELARRGLNIILVTHSLGQAARLSQTVYRLAEGRLVSSGPAEEAQRPLRPATLAG